MHTMKKLLKYFFASDAHWDMSLSESHIDGINVRETSYYFVGILYMYGTSIMSLTVCSAAHALAML